VSNERFEGEEVRRSDVGCSSCVLTLRLGIRKVYGYATGDVVCGLIAANPFEQAQPQKSPLHSVMTKYNFGSHK